MKIHPKDNVIVALRDYKAGEKVIYNEVEILLLEDIPIKHKYAERDFKKGEYIIMYGIVVGKATQFIPKGCRISTENTKHSVEEYSTRQTNFKWQEPDTSRFRNKTFEGYYRMDGKVGTMNYWVVIPLVFCENRNIEVIKEAMLTQLGYATERDFVVDTPSLINAYKSGASQEEILEQNIVLETEQIQHNRLFPNVDGIKFLKHEGGCGGTRQDSESLCRLLAGYITNPNVAGATVLSLGCQHAQFQLLKDALHEFDANLEKPVYILEQQKSKSERDFIAEAVKKTFVGLIKANKYSRKSAPLSKLSVGLECGGSDGFSGISANPALGYASDLVVALGGTTLLSEFPELCGVEQELVNRCVNEELAEKFTNLMKTYNQKAESVGSGFEMNPSPGNIKDGLITDAIKSAGAAKKGGTSPIVGILDYTEQPKEGGLHLLCTPGNDVESTTGLAGLSANIIVFTTGLGTPTGNPITPTIKMATNTRIANLMPDIIDIDAGTIISGEDTIETKGEELLELIIEVASGRVVPNAIRLGQDDFIPWKRGISL